MTEEEIFKEGASSEIIYDGRPPREYIVDEDTSFEDVVADPKDEDISAEHIRDILFCSSLSGIKHGLNIGGSDGISDDDKSNIGGLY